jgi:hypothetical protein
VEAEEWYSRIANEPQIATRSIQRCSTAFDRNTNFILVGSG